jgi:hypothetical protein
MIHYHREQAFVSRLKISGTVAAVLATLAIAAGLWLRGTAEAAEITVYKSPTCNCCSKWVTHLERHGFKVITRDIDDVSPLKARLGVSPELASCHTALVDGYVIEGHVPADLIGRLLNERPSLKGLAVPRMPVGSPGMEGPNPEQYEVLGFDADGNSSVYATRTGTATAP